MSANGGEEERGEKGEERPRVPPPSSLLPPPSSLDRAQEAERRLGVRVRDRLLLEQAFVHGSYLNENPGFPLESNERLEFLGDAVLGFVVADKLYKQFPTLQEGELTSLRAALVRAQSLARIAEDLQLGPLIRLGRGEEASGGRTRRSILAQTFEAVVGAIYLDAGLRTARALLWRLLRPRLEIILREEGTKDPKSRLQEVAQAETGLTPTYHLLSAIGPEHAKVFRVVVGLGERELGIGEGPSKQQAEQAAAEQTLRNWSTWRTVLP